MIVTLAGRRGGVLRVLCDASPCTRLIEVYERNEAAARRHAKQEGWFLGGVKHLCPECREP